MHREEEKEFAMAIKLLKSNKSTAALRAVSRLNYKKRYCFIFQVQQSTGFCT
jgi:hypothetical protein